MEYTQLLLNVILLLWNLANLNLVLGAYTAAKETEIRTETALAATYDAVSRPESQTEVKVGLNVIAIDSLDMKSQTFSTVGWITFQWVDSRLAWNSTAKDDIKYIFCKPGTVWKPELVIDNSLANLGVITDSNLLVKVRYDGTVEWEPPLLFTTHCEVDITYYPYDRQKCAIEAVSWTYTYDEVKLTLLNSNINLEDFVRNGEWVITNTHIYERNLTEKTTLETVLEYPKLDFWFYLERRTEFYNLNVMLPTFLMSILIVLVFIVPVHSGEKLSFVLTVLLSLSVLMTLVSNSLPTTSISVSVLGLYLGTVLVLAGVAVLLTVLVLILFHKEGSTDNHHYCLFVYRLALKVNCKLKATKPTEPKSIAKVSPADDKTQQAHVSDHADGVSVSSVSTNDVEWTEVAHVIDKFCFLIFFVITFATNIVFMVALVVGGKVNEP